MSNDGQKPQGALPRTRWSNGFRSIRTFSRIVSSGASTVASTVKSAASAASLIVDRDNDSLDDQVQWAGFDKLECDGDNTWKVLLLAYRSGFQVWDVDDADNVRVLVTRYDGPVSFLQMLPKPAISKLLADKFADKRPLMVICTDASLSGSGSLPDGFTNYSNGSITNFNGSLLPTVVWFYSLQSQSYVHMLKFRSVVYSVRCSVRVVAISQATQITCLNTATLEREYTFLTNPIVSGCIGSGGVGYGPLAVGCRWLAYSGNPIVNSNSGRVRAQHMTPSANLRSSTSNGNIVAHYAKESGKQLAAGIVNLGDVGRKRLSRYCSELLSERNNSVQIRIPGWRVNGAVSGLLPDADSVGMVIVRDLVNKSVITQFRAHKSPISALCFDPSGTLLVTASVQGHNINVFRIMPCSSGADVAASYVHLYRLQRGFTNTVIQDISFSDDSHWIVISSARGTSHLFAIPSSEFPPTVESAELGFSPKASGLNVTKKPVSCSSPNLLGPQSPVSVSAVNRIRNGNSSWKSTVSGAAVAATGRAGVFQGHIACSFHSSKINDSLIMDVGALMSKYNLLVFSPSGCVVQYSLQAPNGFNSEILSIAYVPDGRLVVEAIQKWNIFHNQNGREVNIDIYGEDGSLGKDPMKAKDKISPDDKRHLYISEAELQMHQACIPLWAKSEMYFQAMAVDGVRIVEDSVLGGEVEIERVSSRVIEGRSKALVPVFEHLQSPRMQQPRIPASGSNVSNQRIPWMAAETSEGFVNNDGSPGRNQTCK